MSKFDAKFLNDSFFARKPSQKDDVGMTSCEDDLHDVFAIEKGASASLDWIRGRKDRYIVSKIALIKDDTDIIVKQEPGEWRSTLLEDDDVEYVGSSSSNKTLDEEMALEVLGTKNDVQVYLATLSPMDVENMMAWDDEELTVPQSNEFKEPFVFTTPTKRSPNELTEHAFTTPTKKVKEPAITTPTKRGPVNGRPLSTVSRESQQEWVRPRTMEELFALKRKQMDQKAKWAVNHALKNSRSA